MDFCSPSVSAFFLHSGWHLDLEVPQPTRGNGILPCATAPSLVQNNLSELYSAPGRQAASMIQKIHLRSLENKLSTVATATSLAETNPSMKVIPDCKYRQVWAITVVIASPGSSTPAFFSHWYSGIENPE